MSFPVGPQIKTPGGGGGGQSTVSRGTEMGRPPVTFVLEHSFASDQGIGFLDFKSSFR